MLSRQEWYDAELRQIGVLVHAQHSRRHMIVCFLIRRVLGAIAMLAFLSQVTILTTLSFLKKAADPTPAYLTRIVKISQIVCAILTILIQLYHWKALLGVAAVIESGPNVEEGNNNNELIANMEDGQLDQTEDQKGKVVESENRELSYSEIVTGDRSHCGYSSHQQRTETYLVNNIDDNNDEDETKPDYYEKDTLSDKRGNSRITSKRSSIRFPAYKQCDSDVDDANPGNEKYLSGQKSEGIGCGSTSNDVTSLLNDEHHAQLNSYHKPIVSDKTTWVVVMATCVCFLITAIPASLRTYLSAFLLYSVTTRVLEIITASLLLSPFQIQNTPFRKRLAAKIRGGPVISSMSSTTVACRQDSSITDRIVRGRIEKRSYYSEVFRGDGSPSSLTMSILHKPPACKVLQDAESNDEIVDDNNDAGILEKVSSSEIESLQLHVNARPANDSASLKQNIEYDDSKAGRQNVTEMLVRRDASPLQNDSTWIDRWAKNVRVLDIMKSPTATPDLNRDAANMSFTSSITPAIKATGLSQLIPSESEGTPRQGSAKPCSPTTSSHRVQPDDQVQPTAKETPELESPGMQIKNCAESASSTGSDSRGHSSAVSKESGNESPNKSESPRSVAMLNMDPISPLTGSVLSSRVKNTVKPSVPPSVPEVTGIMNLASNRPQDFLDSDRGDRMKISIVTKEGYSKSTGKKIGGHSKAADNYYERWQNQSQSQSQSKLTYRGGSKVGAEEGRSPHSPRSPEVVCYDGDVDGESSDIFSRFQKKRREGQKGGSKVPALYPVRSPSPVVTLSKSVLSAVDISDTRSRSIVSQIEPEIRQKDHSLIAVKRSSSTIVDESQKKM